MSGEIVEKFREFAQGVGITLPAAIVADGSVKRAGSIGYILHADESPAGKVWDFKDPEGTKHSWRADAAGTGATPTPHAIAVKAAASAEKRAEEKADALPRLRELWTSSDPAPADHPYLVSHGLGGREDIAGLLRVDRSGALLVPFADGDPDTLTGIQIIQPSGRKWFAPGSTYARRFFPIPGDTDTIFIAEGMATAAAVAISTGKQAYATGGAGNMPGVAAVVRARFPEAIIVIAGDHDRGTIDPTDTDTDSRPRNTGREVAEKAAAASGGIAIVPADIPDFFGTDWADVLVQCGGAVVRERLTPTPEMLTRAEKPGEATEELHYTDMGNSRRFVREFGSEVRYCHAWKSWLIWDGRRWRRDEAGEIFDLARRIPAVIAAEAAHFTEQAGRRQASKSEREQLQARAEDAWKGAKAAEQLKNVKAFLEFAQSEPGIAVNTDDLDADLDVLNVANGIIDMRTGELHPHDRKKLCTKLIDIHYTPGAAAPRWEKAVIDFTDKDTELAYFLQRAVGYSLTGRTNEQCVFILHGRGRNGKSLFADRVGRIAGDYGQQADFSLFLEKEQDKISNDIARLCGARFVAASEGEAGKRLAEAAIKHMTGGEKMVARFLHKEYFEFRPQFSPWLATNHRPQIRGTDEGIWRRIRLIPCRAYFDPKDDDPQLMDTLDAEMPGILAWAVQGAVQWYRGGLGIAEAVATATSEFREEMDSIGAWLAACCSTDDPGAITPLADIYASYAAWIEAAGEGVLSQRKFNDRMKDRGIENGPPTPQKTTTKRGISLRRRP